MKTTSSKRRCLPKPIRFSLLLIGIALVCLPNWIALKAGYPVQTTDPSAEDLASIVEVDTEPELQLEDWMVSFDAFGLVANNEKEIPLESWMLDFGSIRQYAVIPYDEAWYRDFESWGFNHYRIRY